MELNTIGDKIYPGREVPLWCAFDARDFMAEAYGTRFQAIHVKEGFGILKNGSKSQLITAPALLCFNEKEQPVWADNQGIRMDMLLFHPSVYNEAFHFDYPWSTNGRYTYDSWSMRPFVNRDVNPTGAVSINWLMSKRLSQLMHQVDEELTCQRDYYWPCRSRSFFVELLILASSIHEDYKTSDRMTVGTLSEDIQPIIQYLHSCYAEKTTLLNLTTRFHTNKTTLNARFKSETGMTVMDYLNHLRIEIACSLLKNTDLTVQEILARVGFKDTAHFGRIFRKYKQMTPTDYREG